jgi:hypothetical protein
VYQFGLNLEMAHEATIAGYNCQQIFFSHHITEQSNGIFYSFSCSKGSSDLFGCFGMKRAKHCILNKQYSKEKYEELVPKIIKHMQKTGEWGEYFPTAVSPFAYNETRAQEYFPLTRETVIKKGWKWREETEVKSYKGPRVEVPDDIADVPDSLCKQVLVCQVTGRPYKVIPQELRFYKDHQIPVPRLCPEERHLQRLALRSPRRLWPRACAKCAAPIQTTYAPDRPEKVYCEACYLKEVY